MVRAVNPMTDPSLDKEQQQQQQQHPLLLQLFDDHSESADGGGSVSVGDGRYSEHIEAACVAANARRARAGLLLPDNEEKVRKRRISNLQSVRESRKRKKERVEQFQLEANRLLQANAALKQENEQLEGVLKQVEWVIQSRHQQGRQLSFVCNTASMNPFQSTTTTSSSTTTTKNEPPNMSSTKSFQEILPMLPLSHSGGGETPASLTPATAGWGPKASTKYHDAKNSNGIKTLGESSTTATFASGNLVHGSPLSMRAQTGPTVDGPMAIAHVQTSAPTEEFRPHESSCDNGSVAIIPQLSPQQPQPQTLGASFQNGGAGRSMLPSFPQNKSNHAVGPTALSNLQHHPNNTSLGESCVGMIHQSPALSHAPMQTFSMMMPQMNSVANSFGQSAMAEHMAAAMPRSSTLQLNPSFYAPSPFQQQQASEQSLPSLSHDTAGNKPRTCLHPAFYFGSSSLNSVTLRQPTMQQQQQNDVKPFSSTGLPHAAAASAAAATISPPMGSPMHSSSLAGAMLIAESAGPRNCLHPSFYFGAMAPGAVRLRQVSEDRMASSSSTTRSVPVAAASPVTKVVPNEVAFTTNSIQSMSSSTACDFPRGDLYYGSMAPLASAKLGEVATPKYAMGGHETRFMTAAADDDCHSNNDEGSCYSSFDEEVNMVTL